LGVLSIDQAEKKIENSRFAACEADKAEKIQTIKDVASPETARMNKINTIMKP
jgi:hypothetical protein